MKKFYCGRKLGQGINDLKSIIDSDITFPIIYIRKDKENLVIITENEYLRLKNIENVL